jgi:hypothetical protein
MHEHLRDFVALNCRSGVAAVGELFDHPGVEGLQHFDSLLPIVDIADPSAVKLPLEVCFLLSDDFVRQLDLLVISAVNLVPDEPVNILAGNFDLFVNCRHSLLTTLRLFFTIENDLCQLFQLIPLQKFDIHHVD